jgi:hypothetical protein
MAEHPMTSKFGSPLSASTLLEMYFFDIRSHLLEAAAAMDRIQRAPGGLEVMEDERMRRLIAVCDILKNGSVNRAEQFLQLFSDPV